MPCPFPGPAGEAAGPSAGLHNCNLLPFEGKMERRGQGTEGLSDGD